MMENNILFVHLKASNDGIPDKTAFLQTGSPS